MFLWVIFHPNVFHSIMITALKQNEWLSPEIHRGFCPGSSIICWRAAKSPFWWCCRLPGLCSIVQKDWFIMWVLRDTFSLWKINPNILGEKTLYSHERLEEKLCRAIHLLVGGWGHICICLCQDLFQPHVLSSKWNYEGESSALSSITGTFFIIWCYWPINNWKSQPAVP